MGGSVWGNRRGGRDLGPGAEGGRVELPLLPSPGPGHLRSFFFSFCVFEALIVLLFKISRSLNFFLFDYS